MSGEMEPVGQQHRERDGGRRPKPIRILHVLHTFGTGGAEAGVRKLIAGLDGERFEQSVCTVLEGPARDPQTGARIVSLGRRRGSRGPLVLPFRRLFARELPHIIHARNWGAIEAIPGARLARVPGVIYSEHGLDVRTAKAQPWRRNAFRRLCFRWADQVFTVSEGLRNYFVPQLRMAAERLPVIANGVDTDRFRPLPQAREELRRELRQSADAFVVGTVSRLDPVKDHRTLFRAAEKLLAQGRSLQLVVLGDGPERAALQAEVEASPGLRGHVLFAGERGDVARWLQCLDVFVLPSLAEGMSNTLLEAMASGVAPVASRVGGNPEVIEEGQSGLLFEAGNATALAACLNLLAQDASRREQLAVGARRRVQSRFRLGDMLQQYARLYEQVAAAKRVLGSRDRRDFAGEQTVLRPAAQAIRKTH